MTWDTMSASQASSHLPHGPKPHCSPSELSAPTPVMLQQGWSPAPQSSTLTSHGTCQARPNHRPMSSGKCLMAGAGDDLAPPSCSAPDWGWDGSWLPGPTITHLGSPLCSWQKGSMFLRGFADYDPYLFLFLEINKMKYFTSKRKHQFVTGTIKSYTY